METSKCDRYLLELCFSGPCWSVVLRPGHGTRREPFPSRRGRGPRRSVDHDGGNLEFGIVLRRHVPLRTVLLRQVLRLLLRSLWRLLLRL